MGLEDGLDDKVLFAEERKKSLIEYVNQHERVTVPELCENFSVSSATIRNDLRELDDIGALTRTHGGAIKYSLSSAQIQVIPERSDSVNQSVEMHIAQLALESIVDGDTIILDAGVITKELAKILHRKSGLSIVTNDLNIAAILEGNNNNSEVFVIGGILRKGQQCTVINGMFSMLGALSVDKAFMCGDSFSLRKGAGSTDVAFAEVKKQMVAIAAKVILLCENSRLEVDSFVNFALPEDIDVLLSNEVSEDLKKNYEERGIIIIDK